MDQFKFEPIIPIWLMAIICVVLLVIKRKGIIPYIRQIIMVLLLFAINLRPMYVSNEVKVMTRSACRLKTMAERPEWKAPRKISNTSRRP